MLSINFYFSLKTIQEKVKALRSGSHKAQRERTQSGGARVDIKFESQFEQVFGELLQPHSEPNLVLLSANAVLTKPHI